MPVKKNYARENSLRNIYSFITNLGYIYYIGDKKINRLLTYIKLLINHSLLNIYPIKEEKLFGFRVRFFNHSTFLDLYKELFLKEEYRFYSKNREPIILDLGSNIGMASIYFKLKYPRSKIYCFEPDPETYLKLEKNIHTNSLKDIKIYRKAISSQTKNVFLYRPIGQKGSEAQSTFFQNISFEKNVSREKIPIETIKLSKFILSEKIERIDFLKMDIEGDETNAIIDLDKHDLLNIIEEGIIEYHHEIEQLPARLSIILNILEKNKFNYNLESQFVKPGTKNLYQNIMIHFYRKN